VQWQALNAQSASVVKATGGAANVTATQVHNLATSLEGQTSTQAESIQSGANMLLTFKNIQNEAGKGNDIFNQSTKTLVDMSRAMGTDPQQAAIQLGKALNDPVKGISALTRVGVTFDAQQKADRSKRWSSGNTMGAQKIILAELNSEFGGSGAAYRATFPGQMYQMRDAVGDFGESIATAALPALSLLVGRPRRIVELGDESGVIEKHRDGRSGPRSRQRGPPSPFFASFGVRWRRAGRRVLPADGRRARATDPRDRVQAATAFSPLRIAFMALAPVLPVISLALTQLGSALGQGLLARSPRSRRRSSHHERPRRVPRPPAEDSRAGAGGRGRVPRLEGATAGFAFAGIVTGLVTTTVQLGVNAAAWVRNAAAQVASKAQTVAIMAMYAGEFVANLVRSGVALGVQAAQWIASTAAMVAARVAMVAGAIATGVATAAQWALNAALSANPIGIVVVAIAALVAA
jgi:hypothetical protein